MADNIRIDGHEYALDDFELGDLEWLEDYIGKPLTNLANLNSVKASVGLVYIVKHRADPAYTIEQARAEKLSVIFPDDEEPEAAPAAKRPPKPAARS